MNLGERKFEFLLVDHWPNNGENSRKELTGKRIWSMVVSGVD
jgi:hypothetical protein